MKTILSRTMWVGRATVFLVGLAVILALVFGAASTALGANGMAFILGESNSATKMSTLIKKGVGPALGLKVGAQQPPLSVNAAVGTATNLSADELTARTRTRSCRSSGRRRTRAPSCPTR